MNYSSISISQKIRINPKNFNAGDLEIYVKPDLITEPIKIKSNRKGLQQATKKYLAIICQAGHIDTAEIREWCDNFDKTTEVIKDGYNRQIKG